MYDVLTKSGAVIRTDHANPTEHPLTKIAIAALGRAVTIVEVEKNQNTVLEIMEQMLIGTELTHEDGVTYTLQPDNRWHDGEGNVVSDVPYEGVFLARLPGGWTWAREAAR